MRLKYFRSTSKAPVLTARKSREVVCMRLWLHKPHVTISRPHALTPQYSVVVTQTTTRGFLESLQAPLKYWPACCVHC